MFSLLDRDDTGPHDNKHTHSTNQQQVEMTDHPRSNSSSNNNNKNDGSISHAQEDGRGAKRPRLTDEDHDRGSGHTQVVVPLQQQQPPPTADDSEQVVEDSTSQSNEVSLLTAISLQQGQNAFVSVEEQERQAAEERRRQRQQRLQQLRQQQQQQQVDEVVETTTAKNTSNAKDSIAVHVTTSIASTKNAMVGKPKVAASSPSDHDDDDDDEFDMFSSPVENMQTLADSSSNAAATTTTNPQQQSQQQRTRGAEQQDWDDAEGYYKAVIGEIIHLDPTGGGSSNNNNNNDSTASAITLRVAGLIGKGVFSTVLQCNTLSNSTSLALPPVTAVKFIRNNETMARAALTEIQILQRLKGAPGIVPMLLPTTTSNHDGNPNDSTSINTGSTRLLEHRGHTILVFNFMQYNLRDVLQKFGKGVGLSLPAVRSYFGQLLAAATHLQKHGILHLDLKPDNILVSADFAVAQLADFGSAMDQNHSAELLWTPAPYLVSRFYRAPELILGLTPVRHAVDLWSLAVTVAELFLGNVLFRGTSNNDMLYVMQQHLGPCPNRLIRQHLVQCQKYGTTTTPQHFRATGSGAAYCFLQQTADPVSGAPVHRELPLVVVSRGQPSSQQQQQQQSPFPGATPLHPKLLKAQSAKDGRRMVQLFSDLLQQCLVLDPTKRIALKDALRHEFFQPAPTPRGNNNNNNHARPATTSES